MKTSVREPTSFSVPSCTKVHQPVHGRMERRSFSFLSYKNSTSTVSYKYAIKRKNKRRDTIKQRDFG